MDLSRSEQAPASVRPGGTAGVPPEVGALYRRPDQVATEQSGENFPVALRVLPRRVRGHLRALYGYARYVDDLGDEAPGDRMRLLDAVEADLDRLYAGGRPTLPVIAALAPTVRERALPAQPLRDLLAANRLDQRVSRYRSYDDLAGYCALSANPVGRLVLQIAGQATPDRVAWSDDVCTALQIIEHLQDIGEDYRAGRIYLPQRDLAGFGVAEAELAAAAASPALRRLVAAEARRAAELLDSGRPLVASLRGWARLAVAGYVAGGRTALMTLADSGFDPLGRAPRPAAVRTAVEAVRLVRRDGWPPYSRPPYSRPPYSRPPHGRPPHGRPPHGQPPHGQPPRPVPDHPTVERAYVRCEQITRAEAKNFSYGIRLLPKAKRGALSAVYAFARRIDDIGDGALPAADKLAALAAAQAAVRAPERHPDDPVLVALADAARRLPVPLPAFVELVEGCEMDVRGARYRTFAELDHYCRCVAGSIGRLSLGVFAPDADPDAVRLADQLGVALQLTNILRDIREDFLNGRVYLPQDDLDEFGVVLALSPDGRLDPQDGRLARLIRREAARARALYEEGLRLLPMLDWRSAACCAAMAGIYRQLLDVIDADPEQVCLGRTALSSQAKLAVAARALLRRVA
jgi:phytoene synthase